MNAPSELRDGTLTPSAMLALLAAAPHRLLFFAGASGVLLSMAWWAAWLVGVRWSALALPPPPVPAGWAHAIGMQYQVLGLFIFGFLLTVFPRWMDQPAFGRRHYVPVAGAIFAGYLLTLASLLGFPLLLHAGGNAGPGSMKSQFKRADASGARFALVFGADELASGQVAIKPLRDAAAAQSTRALGAEAAWAAELLHA